MDCLIFAVVHLTNNHCSVGVCLGSALYKRQFPVCLHTELLSLVMQVCCYTLAYTLDMAMWERFVFGLLGYVVCLIMPLLHGPVLDMGGSIMPTSVHSMGLTHPLQPPVLERATLSM